MQRLSGLPPDLSVHGHEIDFLINFLHIFMIILFVGWGIFYCLWLYQFRARPGHKAVYAPVKASASKWVELAVVVVEGVLLVGLSMPAWAVYKTDLTSEPDALVIRVVAQQFAWNVWYPGPDGVFGPSDIHLMTDANTVGLDDGDAQGQDDLAPMTISQNHLYVPAGKPVVIRLRSKDVIHSFSIPNLRVKQDVIPGMEIPIHFEVDEEAYAEARVEFEKLRVDWRAKRDAGEELTQLQLVALGVDHPVYDIACAQLCGNNHFKMQGFVHILPQDEFEAWLESAAVEEVFVEEEFEDDFFDEEEDA